MFDVMIQRQRNRAVQGLLTAALPLVILSGCSSTGPLSPLPSSTSPAASPGPSATLAESDQPAWSAQIKEAEASSSSDLEKAILHDGMITAAEAAAARGAFSACMAAYGFQVEWEGDSDAHAVRQGTSPPTPEEMANLGKREAECTKSTPMLALSLYYQMRRNPQKQDEFTIIAACLVRKGVMPAGYTATDFARDRAMQPPPKQFETEDAATCMVSPLAP